MPLQVFYALDKSEFTYNDIKYQNIYIFSVPSKGKVFAEPVLFPNDISCVKELLEKIRSSIAKEIPRAKPVFIKFPNYPSDKPEVVAQINEAMVKALDEKKLKSG